MAPQLMCHLHRALTADTPASSTHSPPWNPPTTRNPKKRPNPASRPAARWTCPAAPKCATCSTPRSTESVASNLSFACPNRNASCKNTPACTSTTSRRFSYNCKARPCSAFRASRSSCAPAKSASSHPACRMAKPFAPRRTTHSATLSPASTATPSACISPTKPRQGALTSNPSSFSTCQTLRNSNALPTASCTCMRARPPRATTCSKATCSRSSASSATSSRRQTTPSTAISARFSR